MHVDWKIIGKNPLLRDDWDMVISRPNAYMLALRSSYETHKIEILNPLLPLWITRNHGGLRSEISI